MVVMVKGGVFGDIFQGGLFGFQAGLDHRNFVINRRRYQSIGFFCGVHRYGNFTKTYGARRDLLLVTIRGTFRGDVCYLQLVTHQLVFTCGLGFVHVGRPFTTAMLACRCFFQIERGGFFCCLWSRLLWRVVCFLRVMLCG